MQVRSLAPVDVAAKVKSSAMDKHMCMRIGTNILIFLVKIKLYVLIAALRLIGFMIIKLQYG